MKFVLSALVVGSFPLLVLQAQSPAPQAPSRQIDYDKDIRPLLSQNCYSCHGPEVQQSGLRLDLRQNALRGGDYGPVIVPGKSHESKLIRRLIDGDGGMQMPPAGALLPDEVAVLRAWVDQGAEFRNDVAEEAPPTPLDPVLATMITAARSGSRSAMESLLGAHRDLLNAKDPGGSTLLHHAAAFGAIDTLTFLLDAGADLTAKNRRGSTPLHWAIHDDAKVRLLLGRGAAVNVKQVEGRTPLYQAASLGNATAIVKLLLARGADPNIAIANGRTPLMAAAGRGDVEAMTLLLDAKALVDAKDGAGETALILAAGDGNPQAVRLLLDRGADLNVRNIRGYSPLMLAASSDAIPVGAVKLLLAKGADVSFTGDYNEGARQLAAKRGDTEVARLLGAMPTAPHAAVSHVATGSRSPAAAVGQALSMIEKQSYNFIRIGGCNSCHSQDLASVAAAYARSRGFHAPQIPQLPQSMMPSAERVVDFGIIGAASIGWELFDFGMNGVAKSPYTDAAVRAIKAMQTPQGNWSANESRRPPMNAGDFNAAAVAIYAIKHYTPAGNEATSEQAMQRAVAWLEQATPITTQDRAFHALALAWANNGSESSRKSARALLPTQRPDGGWSQLPGLSSDAYATGQALFALHTAGKVPVTDAAYRKGIDYLLRTQASDGTWHVKSRSIWLQPYFESGFPYGQDQFISVAGTAWASMALAAATQSTTTSSQR